MRKRKGYVLSVFLILVLVAVSGAFQIRELGTPKEASGKERIGPLQNTEKGEKRSETDSHYIQLLKQIKEKVDGWLKSLNERIEKEDVTRFEVRFLEILRNILEWVKEKVDSKIESSEGTKPGKREKGLLRETDQKVFQFFQTA